MLVCGEEVEGGEGDVVGGEVDEVVGEGELVGFVVGERKG